MRSAVIFALLCCGTAAMSPRALQAAPQEQPGESGTSLSRIKKGLDRPPAPLKPSGELQLRPTFRSEVIKHPFVPTLEEHLHKTFDLTDFQRQIRRLCRRRRRLRPRFHLQEDRPGARRTPHQQHPHPDPAGAGRTRSRKKSPEPLNPEPNREPGTSRTSGEPREPREPRTPRTSRTLSVPYCFLTPTNSASNQTFGSSVTPVGSASTGIVIDASRPFTCISTTRVGPVAGVTPISSGNW